MAVRSNRKELMRIEPGERDVATVIDDLKLPPGDGFREVEQPLAGFVAASEPELVSAGNSQKSRDCIRLAVPFGEDPILAGPPAPIELTFGAKPQGTPPHIQPDRPSFRCQAQLADQKLRLARQRRHLFWISLKEQIPNPV